MEVTDWLLSQVIDYVIFFGGFILVLWRQAHLLLFAVTGCACVAVGGQHFDLAVDELAGANLKRVLRLKFVRGRVIG